MKNIDNLFVYGTLQKGKQHSNILEKIDGSWKKAFVKGYLINISSGTDYGYPAIKLDEDGLKIYGLIFHSKDLEKKLVEIDEFEGENYKRIVSKINLENGSKVDAYLYEIQK